MLEIDRWALARTAELQAEIVGTLDAARGVFEGGHYGVYEFHPVVAKLQVFCSEDLGAFYLDILKDRLYTTAAGSHGAALGADRALARRPRDAALDGALPQLHRRGGVEGVRAEGLALDLRRDLQRHPGLDRRRRCSRSGSASRAVRAESNRQIESLRTDGKLGSSLQAEVTVAAGAATRATRCARSATTCGSCSSPRRPPSSRCPPPATPTFEVRADGQRRRQVRALLALPRRRRQRSGASDDLRPLHEQPVRRRRAAARRLMAARRRALALALARHRRWRGRCSTRSPRR